MNLIPLVEIQVFKRSYLFFFVVNKVRIKSLWLISLRSMMYWNLEDEKAAIPLKCLDFRLFYLLLKEEVLYFSEQYHLHIISRILWWSSVVYSSWNLWEVIAASSWLPLFVSLGHGFGCELKFVWVYHLLLPPWQCLIMNRGKDFSRPISWIYILWK